MNIKKIALNAYVGIAMLAFVPQAAMATATPAEIDRLGKDLTPTGAEKAANKDGTIPAWTGGLAKPPAGWNPAQGYVDPFADEKPTAVITGANADKYKENLSAGTLALLKKNPNFKMPLYPTHRTAVLPQKVQDAVKAEAGKIRMEGFGVVGRERSTVPFPVPKTGEQAIQNHLLRYFGGGFERDFVWAPVRSNGEHYTVGFHDKTILPSNFEPAQSNDLSFGILASYNSPATLEGTVFLVHDFIDPVKNPRAAWIYNAGQRRVRRAPDLSHDGITDGTDAMRVTDQYFGYNGAIDRYNWKLVGKKEVFVPYNTYKIGDKKLKYSDIIRKGSVNADLMRYELHRVWVVEATLKQGQKHVYGKRTFYLDEDSWLVLMEDAYDTRGDLWRVGVHGFVQYYDALVPWHSVQIWHDLTNGNYLVSHLNNEVKTPIKFGVTAKWNDFQPDALRRRGVK